MIWEINLFVSEKLNKFVIDNNFEQLVWVFSDLPIFFIPIFFIWTWLYYTFIERNIDKKKSLIFIFIAIVIWVIINLIIQYFVNIPRPETFVKPILYHLPDASFPSDHALVSFAFLTWLYVFKFYRTFWFFLTFVIIMNISRIAWWIHWFWDIVVWALIWIILWILSKNFLAKNTFFIKISDFLIKLAKVFKL